MGTKEILGQKRAEKFSPLQLNMVHLIFESLAPLHAGAPILIAI